jgi:hypothetical protein
MNPNVKMPKIQLIVVKQGLSVVNYIMTYFDIDYCKVAINGANECFKYTRANTISDHIFNVFRLFNDNLLAYDKTLESSNVSETQTYYLNLINSMKYYILKIEDRYNKYLSRGVIFDTYNIEFFRSNISLVNNVIINFKNMGMQNNTDIDKLIDNIIEENVTDIDNEVSNLVIETTDVVESTDVVSSVEQVAIECVEEVVNNTIENLDKEEEIE